MRFVTVTLFIGICACAAERDSAEKEPTVGVHALRQVAGNHASPCDAVHCVGTQRCIEVDGRPRCVLQRYEKDAGTLWNECRVDADCGLQANYCGGCNCDAVPTRTFVAADRECELVACLVDPCRDLVASCKEGQCVVGPNASDR